MAMGVENHYDDGVHVQTRRCGVDRHGWSRGGDEGVEKQLNSKLILKIESAEFFRTWCMRKREQLRIGLRNWEGWSTHLQTGKHWGKKRLQECYFRHSFSLRCGVHAQV